MNSSQPYSGPSAAPEIAGRLSRIRLLVLDVDGVMTDGSVSFVEGGGELVRFNIKDGAGIVFARRAGLEVGLLTGRDTAAVSRRAGELGIERVLQGVSDKGAGLASMVADGKYTTPDLAYMGDDIMDLPAFRLAGFSACPADAHPAVAAKADYICSRPGGHGAVREFIDLILSARGLLGALERSFWEGTAHA